MADLRICSIDGCGKKHYARNLCQPHYQVWRNDFVRQNGPIGRPDISEQQAYFRDIVLPHSGADCLIWPYARDKDGYGRVNWTKGTLSASRSACLERHGPPPSPRHQAAHNCGNGHLGCVNPNHLRWATPLENAADIHIHGTDRKTYSKRPKHWLLDEQAVRRIRADTRAPKVIAADYGVKPVTVYNILARRIWKRVA